MALIGVRIAALQPTLLPKNVCRWRARMVASGRSGRNDRESLGCTQHLGDRAAGRPLCPRPHHLVDAGEAVLKRSALDVAEGESAWRDLVQPRARAHVAV